MVSIFSKTLIPISFFLLFISCSNSPNSEDTLGDAGIGIRSDFTTEFDLEADEYLSLKIHGFHVLLEEKAINESTEETNEALDILRISLSEILELNIRSYIKDSLIKVPIFVDLNTKEDKAAVYHPNREWLQENGYPVEKERAVEITNITNFISWTEQNQPFMVFHELAHAYHHRIFNFDNEDITNAYQNALQEGLYLNVGYHEGGGNYTTRARAYGLANEIEFFAEATEAYFGMNDFYPYERTDLLSYDSVSYAMIEKVWGVQ